VLLINSKQISESDPLVYSAQCADMADANGMGLCHWSMVSDYLPLHENPAD
jgi:hypothetical protein